MEFEKGNLYHIYNQGNNRQGIFFSWENYRFFLRKIKTHIVPFVDLLAWCLMPNHFHLMTVVREEELYVNPAQASSGGATSKASSGGATKSRTPTRCCSLIETLSRTPPKCVSCQEVPKKISLNHSIGIMLASYTRAIHKQENVTGSLFRQKTNRSV